LDIQGKHLLVEYLDCDPIVLSDVTKIQVLMEQAAVAAKTKVVASVFHPFSPQGVSGVVVIEESHLSIHTWPEHKYAAVDFYTCGKGDPYAAYEFLKKELQASKYEVIHIDRGTLGGNSLMHIKKHFSDTSTAI